MVGLHNLLVFRVVAAEHISQVIFWSIQAASRQERFRTLTSSYYIGAQEISLGMLMWFMYILISAAFFFLLSFAPLLWHKEFIIVYDVTRRETSTNLSEVWSKELELYSTYQELVKMLVGNKVDR
ncbi:hypothetical protein P8452_76533 [Trifolium repens]|nr:hypothetical protein P8452_76533 [Trifolium repens]